MNIQEYFRQKALLCVKLGRAPVSEGRVRAAEKPKDAKQPQREGRLSLGRQRRSPRTRGPRKVLSKKPDWRQRRCTTDQNRVGRKPPNEAKKMLGRTFGHAPGPAPRGKQSQPHLIRRDGIGSKPNCTSRCWWIAERPRIGFVLLTRAWMDIEEWPSPTP